MRINKSMNTLQNIQYLKIFTYLKSIYKIYSNFVLMLIDWIFYIKNAISKFLRTILFKYNKVISQL